MRAGIRGVARRLGYDVSRVRGDENAPQPLPDAYSPPVLDVDEYAALVEEYRDHPLCRLPAAIWPVAQSPDEVVKDVDTTRFRADNAYVWQTRGQATSAFVVSALWAQGQDAAGVLATAQEDGAYGAEVLAFGGRRWSRDLIDSTLEINALAPVLASCGPRPLVVDIGAGYGRLLHRLAEWSPSLDLVGVDGVALSTALARGYLRHRGVADRVRALSLGEADLLEGPIDLATNIHSFSEMSRAAVGWWLDWLAARGTRHLFIVPNQPGPRLNDGTEFGADIEARGFRLERRWWKYDDPVIASLGLYQAEYLLYSRPASPA